MALELGLLAFFFILGQLVHLVVQVAEFALVQAQLGQAAFVINGHRGAVFLRLLHVVHMDVLAKHRSRVAVCAAHRRAGEGSECGLGQGVAQVLRVTGLVLGVVLGRRKVSGASHLLAVTRDIGHRMARTIFDLARFELGFKTILRAVRFVSNHHDVAPLAQHREGVFIFPRHELLDGGKNDAARRPVVQQLAQPLPRCGLLRLLAQQVLAQAEHAQQLAV